MKQDERIEAAVEKVPSLRPWSAKWVLQMWLDEGVIAFVEDCKDCNGVGLKDVQDIGSRVLIYSDNACPQCNGTGKVVVKDE